eukprot:14298529-Heterocapsa_arctica.AAC.1
MSSVLLARCRLVTKRIEDQTRTRGKGAQAHTTPDQPTTNTQPPVGSAGPNPNLHPSHSRQAPPQPTSHPQTPTHW